MHLVGFIIRIYHDARSSELQRLKRLFVKAVQYVRVYYQTPSVLGRVAMKPCRILPMLIIHKCR